MTKFAYRNNYLRVYLVVVLVMFTTSQLCADEIRVAVASNFIEVMKKLSVQFAKHTSHKVKLSSGSTGKHYAQIINGAPYDVFFAADEMRPRLLEEKGHTVLGTRSTYAKGKLVLWSPDEKYIDRAGEVLHSDSFRYLAIANPKHAPYGRAAREVLQARDLWVSLKGRIVRGENISQTLRFVKTGNAELGLVAAAQIYRPGKPVTGSVWDVPQHLYTPINQQMVIIKNSEAARLFTAYMKSKEAMKIIRKFGYETP